MSGEAEYSMTCDACDKDITGEKCYCEDCKDGGSAKDMNLKNKALKNLFSSDKVYNIEEMFGLSQLEFLTLRDMVG